jgi:DNA-binding protein H-NS
MENIYVQILRLWLYIYELQSSSEKDTFVGEPKSITEWLDIELDKLSVEDKISLIGEICDDLPAQQLRTVRELADQKRLEKLDEAKEQVIARMREEFEQLDLDFDEVMGRGRRGRGKSPIPPKYRNPEGKEWSGRGYAPMWMREYEESGGNRDDYLIKGDDKNA